MKKIKDRLALAKHVSGIVGPRPRIVEVGVLKGHFVSNYRKFFKDPFIYLVDSWKSERLYRGQPCDSYNATAMRVRNWENVSIVKADSLKAAEQFEDNSLDWVYIDADHRYESVKKDLEAWWPKVREGGIMSGHDFDRITPDKDPSLFGVKKAVVEFFGEGCFDTTNERNYNSWYITKLPGKHLSSQSDSEKQKYVITLNGGIGNIIQSLPLMHYLRDLGHVVLAKQHPTAYSEEICQLVSPAYDALIDINEVVPGAIDKGPIDRYLQTIKRETSEWQAWFIWHGLDVPPPSQLRADTRFAKGMPSYDVVLAPTSKPGWFMKKWPWWQQLVEKMPGCAVVGLKEDGGKIHGDFDDFRGKLNLAEVAGLFFNARYVICEEGGMGHLSCAQRTPTYILFGGTSPIKNLPPRNGIMIRTDKDLPCIPCQFKNCHHVGYGLGREYHGCEEADKIDGWSRCMYHLSADDVISKVSGKHDKIVVFTAIVGDYDTLKDPLVVDASCRYVCFSNRKLHSKVWNVVPFEKMHKDPVRDARFFKTLAHRWFPNADYTVWVDAALRLAVPVNKELLNGLLKGNDVALYGHIKRRCIYQEAHVIIEHNRADPTTVKRQMGEYVSQKMPPGAGLHHTCFIVRRNNNTTQKLNEKWWSEIRRWTRRDQLSFDYCRWKMKIPVSTIPGNAYESPYFEYYPHHPKWQIDILLVKYCVNGKEGQHYTKFKKKIQSEQVLVSEWDNNKKNIGLTNARANLIEKTNQEFVCFTDFDLELSSLHLDWKGMIEGLTDDVGMVLPKSIGFDCCGDDEYAEVKTAVHCHMMLMRRKTLKKLGGLDRRFFLYRADLDLIRRVRGAGLKIVQHTPSTIRHLNFTQHNPHAGRIRDEDFRKYKEKWGDSKFW